MMQTIFIFLGNFCELQSWLSPFWFWVVTLQNMEKYSEVENLKKKNTQSTVVGIKMHFVYNVLSMYVIMNIPQFTGNTFTSKNTFSITFFFQIYTALQAAQHMKVYKTNEIPDRYHYKRGKFVSPLTLVADPGWFISEVCLWSKSHQKISKWKRKNAIKKDYSFYLVFIFVSKKLTNIHFEF